jgi:hypothetical protein
MCIYIYIRIMKFIKYRIGSEFILHVKELFSLLNSFGRNKRSMSNDARVEFTVSAVLWMG